MDLVIFLTVSMLSLSALQIALLLVHRASHAWSLLFVNALVLAIGGGAMLVVPQWSAVITAAVFVPFVLAPAVLGHMAQRRITMSRPRAAARFAAITAALHPSANNRFMAALYQALALEDFDQTVARLKQLKSRVSPPQQQVVEALLAVRQANWQGLIDQAAQPPGPARGLKAIVIRALGETGAYESMVRAFGESKADLIGGDYNFAQLFVLAFTGRTIAVDNILDNQLAAMGPEAKDYWRGVAQMNATDGPDRSMARLRELSHTATTDQTRRASRRHVEMLAAPYTELSLSPGAVATVTEIERRLAADAPMTRLKLANLVATLTLMAILSGVFVLEIAIGGSEDLRTLVRLGALWPPIVIDGGEWWRLLTSVFLHAGWVHFLANLFVLFVLGRFIEAAMGRLWIVAGFLLGGVVSSAAVLAAMHWGLTGYAILVGASGGIFALFGIEVARQIMNWRQTRDILDARRVALLAAVMVIQFVIDISLPEISLTAHLSGFATGLVLAFAFWRTNRPGRPERAARPWVVSPHRSDDR